MPLVERGVPRRDYLPVLRCILDFTHHHILLFAVTVIAGPSGCRQHWLEKIALRLWGVLGVVDEVLPGGEATRQDHPSTA